MYSVGGLVGILNMLVFDVFSPVLLCTGDCFFCLLCFCFHVVSKCFEANQHWLFVVVNLDPTVRTKYACLYRTTL